MYFRDALEKWMLKVAGICNLSKNAQNYVSEKRGETATSSY